MARKRQIILLFFLCFAMLAIGAQIGWSLRGPPRGMKPLLDILADMEAKPATDADWKAVTLEKGTAEIAGVQMQVVTVRNLRPVLEADGTTSAHHLQVLNNRTPGVLKTFVRSPKAKNAFDFDWNAGTFAKTQQRGRDLQSFLQPTDCPSAVKYTGKYFIGKATDSTKLSICTPLGNRAVAWSRGTFIGPPFFYEDYRYAASIEEFWPAHREGELGLVIFDLPKLDVAGTIELPKQVGRYPPLLIIDPETDLLLCFDLDVAWIVCVDLRPARLAAEAANKKPDAADQNARPASEPKSPPPEPVKPADTK
ncbi:MAG: hypothetical protein NTW87_29430 [Planctomycetota bacterium]|nr:hypothetical protein [Planctomycetota bacterium]